MKRSNTYLLLFLAFFVVLLCNCSKDKAERDNPFDPGGVNFLGWQTPVLYGPSEGSSYTLTWSDVEAGAYSIEESTDGSFTNAKRYNVNSTSYRFSHSDEGEIYYYRVKTNTGNNDSDWSNEISVIITFINFVTIPGGTFQMGDVEGGGNSDEKPVHTVTLSGFDMSTTEITNAQYAVYLNEALASGDIEVNSGDVYGKTGDWSGERYLDIGYVYDSNNKCWIHYNNGTFTVTSGKENWPVVAVTWYGSKAFALYYGLDLPTEAEWEYAARGGKQYKYGTDDGTISTSNVNYWETGIKHPVDVGSYPANPFGLYDMSGNVWEWCSDWHDSYPSDSVNNPIDAQTGIFRVIRGGNWRHDAANCRSAYRGSNNAGGGTYGIGFRVVSR